MGDRFFQFFSHRKRVKTMILGSFSGSPFFFDILVLPHFNRENLSKMGTGHSWLQWLTMNNLQNIHCFVPINIDVEKPPFLAHFLVSPWVFHIFLRSFPERHHRSFTAPSRRSKRSQLSDSVGAEADKLCPHVLLGIHIRCVHIYTYTYAVRYTI